MLAAVNRISSSSTVPAAPTVVTPPQLSGRLKVTSLSSVFARTDSQMDTRRGEARGVGGAHGDPRRALRLASDPDRVRRRRDAHPGLIGGGRGEVDGVAVGIREEAGQDRHVFLPRLQVQVRQRGGDAGRVVQHPRLEALERLETGRIGSRHRDRRRAPIQRQHRDDVPRDGRRGNGGIRRRGAVRERVPIRIRESGRTRPPSPRPRASVPAPEAARSAADPGSGPLPRGAGMPRGRQGRWPSP